MNELRISKSTAYKVWNEFESGKAFYITNKDAYLLSSELMDIAKTMKEKGITASDLLEVYALWELLHRLKLNFSSAIEYLKILENVSDPETIVLSIIGIFQRTQKMHIDPKEIVEFMIDNLERQGELKAHMENERKRLRELVAEKKKISHGVNTLKMKMRDYKKELELVRYIRRRFGGNTDDINNMLKNIGRNGFKLEMLPDLLNIRDIMQRQNIREKDLEEIVLNIKALIKQGITPEGIKRMGKNLGDSSASDAYESMVYWLSHKQEIVQELKDLKNEKEDLIREKGRLNSDIEKIKENIGSAQDEEIAELTDLTSLRNEVNNEKLILSVIEKRRKEQEAWLDFLMKLNPKVPGDIETYLQLLRKIAEKKRELRDLEQNLRDIEELQKNLTNFIKDLGLNISDCMKAREMLEKNKEIIDELPEITEKIKKLMSVGQLKNNEKPARVFKMPSFQKESELDKNEK
ncbi:MAG: hypothetical protein ACP5L4_06480 [Thermoplasmata archaeon]